MVGRTGELNILRRRLGGAGAGHGALVLLVGEPGMGKTTLAAEMVDEARRTGMTAVWGRCREDGGAPAYRPWAQILRGVLKAGGTSPDAGQLDPSIVSLLRTTPAAPAARDEPPDRFRLFEAMTSVLAGAGSQGLLAVVDDLHRADEGSLAFLRYLAPELPQLPVVVLGAYRDSEVGPDHPLASAVGAMAESGNVQVVPLGGLAGAEVRALIERYAGPVPAPVTDEVVSRTGGNPFFVVEIAALLRTATVELAQVAATAIPPTVKEVITHRVRRLPPQTRRALGAAAVLGRDFGHQPLSQILGASRVAVAAALQPAAQARLISSGPSAGYSFNHALVQAAVYETLSAADRMALHGRAAAAILALGRDDDETVSALAYHSYKAAAPGADPRPAFAHTLAAGRRAHRRLAFGEAARWWAYTIELAQRGAGDGAIYGSLLCDTAEAEARAGDSLAARSHYEMAAELARQRQDGPLLARAALGVGSTVVTAGKVDWALVALLEEAETAVTDVADRARLQSRRAIELYWYDGGQASREQSRVALVTAKVSGDKGALGVALHARQFTLRSPEHLHERIGIGERLIELAGRGRHDDMSFLGTVGLAADVMRLGQLPRFRALVGSLEAMAARARRPLWRWYATVMRAQLAAVDGEVDDAYAFTEAAATLGRQLGVDVARAYHLAQLCVLHRDRHGLAPLLAQIEDVAAGLPYFVTIRGLAALAAASSGRMDAASWEVERLSGDRFAAVPRDSLWVATVALLLEAAAISGSPHTGTLVELLGPHRGSFVVQGLPNCWGSVDRFVGRGHLALDHPGPAAECLAAAFSMESKIGAPLFVARTRLDQARLAVNNGDSEEGRALAAQVRATAERLELTALAEEAGQLGGVPAGRQVLSRREREVLALLSRGSSNKDIAADLIISINTVERHLANIHAKLDVRSRAEAAAYAVRSGIADHKRNGGFP